MEFYKDRIPRINNRSKEELIIACLLQIADVPDVINNLHP